MGVSSGRPTPPLETLAKAKGDRGGGPSLDLNLHSPDEPAV